MPLTLDDARSLVGGTLVDAGGSKVGEITDIYIDRDTQTPEWALVRTGLFGGRENFVPLAEASAAGDSVSVPYEKNLIKDAPSAEPDGELSEEEEARLYAHYGLNYSEAPSDSGLPTGTRYQETTRSTRGAVGKDISGRETDDAMTRSEERLRVRTQQLPSRAVRLRKYIVTENVTQTVPVRREEARIEREPITEANIDKAMAGRDLSEEVHEVTLNEERPVVTKETVPVERVRLDKDVVTEQETVTDEVRKERIEVEEPDQIRRGIAKER